MPLRTVSTACSTFRGTTLGRHFGYGAKGRFAHAFCFRWSRLFAKHCEAGQSTVEFAIVAAAFLALALGIGALWHGFSGGMFVEHALMSASHHIEGAAPQASADIVLY